MTLRKTHLKLSTHRLRQNLERLRMWVSKGLRHYTIGKVFLALLLKGQVELKWYLPAAML